MIDDICIHALILQLIHHNSATKIISGISGDDGLVCVKRSGWT